MRAEQRWWDRYPGTLEGIDDFYQTSQNLTVIETTNGVYNDSLFPPVDGVVRTRKVTGGWTLQGLADGTTEVTYEVNADPGGWLPAWIVNFGTKKLPLTTLTNMRQQVKETKAYQTSRLIVKYLYDFSKLLPGDHPALVKSPEEQAQAEKLFEAYKAAAKH